MKLTTELLWWMKDCKPFWDNLTFFPSLDDLKHLPSAVVFTHTRSFSLFPSPSLLPILCVVHFVCVRMCVCVCMNVQMRAPVHAYRGQKRTSATILHHFALCSPLGWGHLWTQSSCFQLDWKPAGLGDLLALPMSKLSLQPPFVPVCGLPRLLWVLGSRLQSSWGSTLNLRAISAAPTEVFWIPFCF